MRVSTFVKRRIQEYVDQHRLVVWYDGECAFGSLAAKLELRDCDVISAVDSQLMAADKPTRCSGAHAVECRRDEGPADLCAGCARGGRGRAGRRHLRMFRAVAGTAFGDQESERLQSLARQAMPQSGDQIDRLFAEGQPTLRTLDGLEKSSGHPLLKQALGTEVPAEIGSLVLADDSAPAKIDAVAGSRGELTRLLQTEFGFESSDGVSTSEFCSCFARYALSTELASALGGGLPWLAGGLARGSG